MKFYYTIIFSIIITFTINAQRGIDKIVPDSLLINNLNSVNSAVVSIQKEYNSGNKEKALKNLAEYFADRMSERYFFNWKNFKSRLYEFKKLSSKDDLLKNYKRAEYQMNLFSADPEWELPSKGQDGSTITAYKLRHLARQHEALDIVLVYYLKNENDKYKNYLVTQVNSLANNYLAGTYDKKGNAIFESFRCGYRVFNWLYVYNYLLASEKFSWREQIDFIKTFYYHAIELDKYANKFRWGNHHTKGLVSEALIGIVFPEFDKSEYWLNRSVKLITEHLIKEVNSDGFQFERSVHYHMGDIDNYFYLYYLAKLNNIKLDANFTNRFQSMFEALVKIALPNKTLPVLQDDTDDPWAEFNNMGNTMIIGAIIFDDPVYKYFADKEISSKLFWLLRESDIEKFYNMKSTKPKYRSVALKETGYYVMRNGWNKSDDVMIISAGLSKQKPDHQHGDMLGVYAYSDRNIILPNYQYRYFLKDYSFFKNSFTKNVALVDSIPQGNMWKGNSGGSGFGKWLELPHPKVITWITDEKYDMFIGSHDKYNKDGGEYFRKIIFIKDGFWIVKDEFISDKLHNYQQVWQGHYTEQGNCRHLLSTFQNGAGLDLVQLKDDNYKLKYGSKRGKGNVVINKMNVSDYSFLTLLYPFSGFEQRLEIDDNKKINNINRWEFHTNSFANEKIRINAENIFWRENIFVIFNASKIISQNSEIQFPNPMDIILKINNKNYELISANSKEDILFKFFVSSEKKDSVKIKPGGKIIVSE